MAKVGKPTLYLDEYANIAYEACKKSGYLMSELAVLFNVSERTIYDWKRDHDDFSHAIKKGVDEHNQARIETSLADRAAGKFTYTEITTEEITLKTKSKDNKSIILPAIKTKTVVKEALADPMLIIFYLCNRDPERWKSLTKVIVNNDTKPLGVGAKQPQETVETLDMLRDPERAKEVARILKDAGVFDDILRDLPSGGSA